MTRVLTVSRDEVERLAWDHHVEIHVDYTDPSHPAMSCRVGGVEYRAELGETW